jgi:FixJ family two-component response regulator
MHAPIMLLVSDMPMLSSLLFSLPVQGFEAIDGAADGTDPSAAGAIVIDQQTFANGLAVVGQVREQGCPSPVLLLATNPTNRVRAQAKAAGAVLIEKPLLGDELAQALHVALATRKAA